MSEASNTYDKILNSATSIFEKATDFKFFNILISFVLLLDICLIKFFHKNILDAFSGDAPITLNISDALLFFCIFSFFMSVFFKSTRQCLLYVFSLISSSTDTEHYSRNGISRKDMFTAEMQAISERDSFILNMINVRRAEIKSMQSQLDVSFSMCCIILYDYYFSSNATTNSLLNIISNYISHIPLISENYVFIALTKLAMFGFTGMTILMLALSLNTNIDNKVDIPSDKKTQH